jgi:DNA-binding Lrp family transcriptional regulator
MIDRRLIGLGSDPDRLNALTLLNERSAGVGEVAEELGIEPAAAGRLLERMHDADLIEVVGEALRRGAVEPRYRALVHVLWDDEDWAALDLEEQKRMSAWIIEMIDADARKAVEAGTIVARQDSHVSRSIPTVDERGWEELLRIHDDALDAVLAVESASAERLAEKGESGFPVLSAMICCEVPPRGAEGEG